jgi:hypothetical protein
LISVVCCNNIVLHSIHYVLVIISGYIHR